MDLLESLEVVLLAKSEPAFSDPLAPSSSFSSLPLPSSFRPRAALIEATSTSKLSGKRSEAAGAIKEPTFGTLPSDSSPRAFSKGRAVLLPLEGPLAGGFQAGRKAGSDGFFGFAFAMAMAGGADERFAAGESPILALDLKTAELDPCSAEARAFSPSLAGLATTFFAIADRGAECGRTDGEPGLLMISNSFIRFIASI